MANSTQTACSQEIGTQTKRDTYEIAPQCNLAQDPSTQSMLDQRAPYPTSSNVMATQTPNQELPECSCKKLNSEVKKDASTQSLKNLKNVQTQSNLNLTNPQHHRKPTKVVIAETSTATYQKSKNENNCVKSSKDKGKSRKCFWRHPIIVVNRDSTSTALQLKSTKNGKEKSAVRIETHDRITQYDIPSDGDRYEDKGSLYSSIPEIIERVDQLESKLRRQERSLRNIQGSIRSWQVQESKRTDCRILFQSNPNDCKPPPPKYIDEKSTQSSERCLTDLEITAAIKKPPTSDQSTQKSDEPSFDDKTLSQEFLEIFMMPRTKSPKDTLNKRCASETDTQRATTSRCAQDVETFLKQFDKVFEKINSQDSICANIKKQEEDKSHRPLSSCSLSPSANTSREEQILNLVEKLVQLASKFKKESVATRKPAPSCAEIRSSSRPSSSRNALPKQNCEPLIQQLVQLFTKSRTEETKSAQKPVEKKSYSDRFMAELTSFFSKPSEQDSKPCSIKEEEKHKKVTISGDKDATEGGTPAANSRFKSISTQSEITMSDLDSKDGNNRPCANESKSTFSEVNGSTISIRAMPPREHHSSGCQCGDGKHRPIGDSLIENLMSIIGGRPLRDVVLTIVRQEGNIYHLSVREMATGLTIGCLLANGIAIREAIALGLFEDINTFCEVDKHRATDPQECPLGANVHLANPRERGGEVRGANGEGMCMDGREFATQVLGLPEEVAVRFFSLTNALKLAKNSSELSIQDSEESDRSALPFGKGAVTGSMLVMNNVENALVSSESESNWRELRASSSTFFPMTSEKD